MRALVLMVAVTVLAFSSAAAEEDLTGTYKLISSKRKIVETGEVLDTWGKNPRGFISCGKDGRMLALIVTDERPKPESLEKITDQDRAKLFRTMTAYGGTYEFDGKTRRFNKGEGTRPPMRHVRSRSKCEELNVSKSSPLCPIERTSMRRAATSLMGQSGRFRLCWC